VIKRNAHLKDNNNNNSNNNSSNNNNNNKTTKGNWFSYFGNRNG
jgi:hypothetical protein